MEPSIELSGILWGTIAGATIVVAGGFYALFFALGRLRNSRAMMAISVLSYAALVLSTIVLARALNLTGFWLFVAAVMLTGYFFAPRAIWRLCVGTHADSEAESANLGVSR